MAASESDTDQVISNLRACLLSMKGGIPITSLDRDYKTLIGHPIPFRKLGFPSLEQFLRSIPNVSIFRGRNGDIILDAIPSKQSEHLAALVSRQKSASRKFKPLPRNYPQRRTAATWKPKPIVSSLNNELIHEGRLSLSVRVSNKVDLANTPERQVTVNNRSPISLSSMNSPGSRPSQHVYERPPRFLRMPSQEVDNNRVPYQLPASTPENYRNSEHQVVQSQVSTPSLKSSLLPNFAEVNCVSNHLKDLNIKPSVKSKLTPLQARLKSLSKNKNFQVPSVIQVEKQFVQAASRTTTQDYSSKLSSVCKRLGLDDPDYKMVARVPTGENVMYSCNVKVGELTYSSFPDEHKIPGEAVQLAACRALQELAKLHDRNGEKKGQWRETNDSRLVMNRVAKIVSDHQNGIWSTQIPLDYQEQYSEMLPEDWLKLMSGCPCVNVEFVASNRIILTPNEPIEDCRLSPALSPVQVVLDPLIFPEENIWDVYVTNATTTDEVWVRLIGDKYSVLYDNMANDMDMLYIDHAHVTLNPEVGCYYAIQQVGCWHRVRLTEILENQMVSVFYIDHGDEEVFNVDMLNLLESKFTQLPPQAIHCALHGLEDFVDDPNTNTHLMDTIIGKTFVAEVISRGTDDYPVMSLVLYDTSGEDDLNVNQLLAEKISHDALPPQLPEGGDIKEVYLSHVSESGDLYLQIQSDSFNYLQTLMTKLVESGMKEDTVAKSRKHNKDPSKLYLARYPVDQEWYRAAVIEDSGLNEVTVLFVDYGNTESISISEMFAMEQLSESLNQFPHQAIKVNLHNVPQSSFSTKMRDRVRELIPDNEPVLVKVVEPTSNGRLPQVEIFKRILKDKQLVSINNTLALDPELMRPSSKNSGAGDGVGNRSKKRLERLLSLTSVSRIGSPDSPTSLKLLSPLDQGDGGTSRGLSPPHIPDIGSFFDVHVTMAANPSNFTVQPYKERVRLEKMMVEIQETYNTRPFPHVTPDTVKEGGLYAALHNDGHWYRVCVSNVINDNMVSVYFCDFGDVSVLHLDKLQPLERKFKELPYQAIKAKLAGIQPSHSDWSVEDCLMFQERVVEHQFVSIIEETGPDLLNPSDTVLGLKLIDTSGPTDIHIDQLLVDQHRAVFTPQTIFQ